jgi:nitroimidazol reductase NimA-like FMN-containing flavoprotein (pyridoxamine 5'-phosphate oxidase superfamily)
MPKLTTEEVNALLDEPGHLARIATTDEDGMPRVLPLWFIVKDRSLYFTPREPAVIWRNIVRDPRVGISIDEETHPYRKLTIQGHVTVAHPPGQDDQWREMYRQIAGRYTPQNWADQYVENTDDQPRALCALDLDAATTKISTWRMPVRGEDPRGIWATRYYLPGTKMREQ